MVEKIKLSIEEKIGQLFICQFPSTNVTGEIIHLVTEFLIGGINIQKENVVHIRQLHKLISTLQLYAKRELPLLVSIEQNGGSLNTITKGVSSGSTQRELGTINNRLYTKQAAQIVARELREIGFTMNVAPSLSLDGTSQSSFSTSYRDTAHHAVAAIQGYQTEGVSAVARIPEALKKEINTARSFIDARTPLYPLAQAVKKGVDAVQVPLEDKEMIARFNELLREKLNFTGVTMSKLRENSGGDDAVMALDAGVDLMFTSGSYNDQVNIIRAVIDAVNQGILSEARINEAYRRVEELKGKHDVDPLKSLNDERLQTGWAKKLLAKLAELQQTG